MSTIQIPYDNVICMECDGELFHLVEFQKFIKPQGQDITAARQMNYTAYYCIGCGRRLDNGPVISSGPFTSVVHAQKEIPEYFILPQGKKETELKEKVKKEKPA